MSVVLKHWLVSSTREYFEGKSVLAGNELFYTFFNGISNETYRITALVDILDLPAIPNITLWNVEDPRTFTITDPQQYILITMPGDTVIIGSRTKINRSFGKVYCIDLDYTDQDEVIDVDLGTGITLWPETTTVNITVTAFLPDKHSWDSIYRQTFTWDPRVQYKLLGLGFNNIRDTVDFIVNIGFEDNFNYAIADKCDLVFVWSFNELSTNINTLCEDGNLYANGLTMRYAVTISDILRFRVIKTSGSDIINITQIV